MVIETSDTVWYVENNKIYKGIVVEDLGETYRVETCLGYRVFPSYDLHETKDELVAAITHESAQIWY